MRINVDLGKDNKDDCQTVTVHQQLRHGGRSELKFFPREVLVISIEDHFTLEIDLTRHDATRRVTFHKAKNET